MTNHPFSWDYAHSRAVVMGTWQYQEFRPLPAAKNSFHRFASMLIGPQCGWPHNSVTHIPNEPHPGKIGDQLIREFKDTRDVALFYYVGHGQIDSRNELCLALTDTAQKEEYRRAATSLTFTAVREALRESEATTKIVILDCCFAGQAILQTNVLSGTRVAADWETRVVEAKELPSLVADKARTNGVYLMAAAGPYSEAIYEEKGRRPQTYFTKYLADVVQHGIEDGPRELTLGTLYERLEQNLIADGHTPPQSRNIDYGDKLLFARNATAGSGRRAVGAPPPAEQSQPIRQGAVLPPLRTANPLPGRRNPRTVVAVTCCVLFAGASGVAFSLLGAHHTGEPAAPLKHAFTLADDHGLDIHRQWTVSNATRPAFTETLTVTNPTGSLLQVSFNEPVPLPVAAELGRTHFSPATPIVKDSGHVLDWQLRVPAHKALTFSYTVGLPVTAVSAAQFGKWVTRFILALAAASKPHALRSLTVQPHSMRLAVSRVAQLTLTGSLPDGKKAPASSLSGVTWQSANRSVVAVTPNGKIRAVRAGSTVITARADGLTASVDVIVTAAPTPTPQATYQIQHPARQHAPAPTGPASSSKGSPSPTVIVTTPPSI